MSKTGKTVLTASAVIVISAASFWVYQSISKYGLEGTIRAIWEGDHLTPEVREAVDTLDSVKEELPAQDAILESIEVSLEVARLESVDDENSNSHWNIMPQWILNYKGDLEKDLYLQSQRLDSLAAKVDSVPSHGDTNLKQEKKRLSSEIVKMMERTDVLLACYEERGEEKQ